jgi:hypothetical protein
MGTPKNNTDSDLTQKMSKHDKIKLTREKIDEVLKELGPSIAPHMTRKSICEMVQKRLPVKPLYDVPTIELIMSGYYTI